MPPPDADAQTPGDTRVLAALSRIAEVAIAFSLFAASMLDQESATLQGLLTFTGTLLLLQGSRRTTWRRATRSTRAKVVHSCGAIVVIVGGAWALHSNPGTRELLIWVGMICSSTIVEEATTGMLMAPEHALHRRDWRIVTYPAVALSCAWAWWVSRHGHQVPMMLVPLHLALINADAMSRWIRERLRERTPASRSLR